MGDETQGHSKDLKAKQGGESHQRALSKGEDGSRVLGPEKVSLTVVGLRCWRERDGQLTDWKESTGVVPAGEKW